MVFFVFLGDGMYIVKMVGIYVGICWKRFDVDSWISV